MLLMLEEEHKEHLSFLRDVTVEVVREFSRISLEFIQKGVNSKVYQTAAQKLQVECDIVQHGVEGLMYLLVESSKLMLNEIDFHDSILTMGFSEEVSKELLHQYLENRVEIRKILTELSLKLPHYHTLEWRFDVQLASRTLRHQVEPIIILKIHTRENGQERTQVLQTDPVNLIHLTHTLEEALQEMKMSHCRRILRNI